MKDPIVAERAGKHFKVVRGYVESYPTLDTNPRWLYDWNGRYKQHGFRIARNR